MSRTLRAALVASMEMDDVEILNPLVGTEVTNIDEALLDVSDAGEEVAQADQTVEVLEDAAEAMESLLVTLESCIAEGGMTPQTARSHNQSVALALRGLPVDAERVTISVESFGGLGDKMSASMESVEGIKAFLKRLWDGIVNAVKTAWEAAGKFVATMGKGAAAIAAGAKQLKERAIAMKGKPVKNEKMDAAAAAKALHQGGKFSGDAAQALHQIAAGGDKVNASSVSVAGELRAVAGKITSTGYDMDAEFTKLGMSIISSVPKDELPGGQKIELSSGGVPQLVAGVAFTDASEITTPSIESVIAIAEAAELVAKKMVDYSAKSFKVLEKGVKDFVATTGKSVGAVGDGDKEKAAAVKKSLASVSKLTTVARGVGPAYCRYMGSSAKVALNFGSSVLKQYVGEKEVAKDAA